ncbi:hypothetical protein DMC64_02965 [Amycolatopsis sp. WAC 04197]|nr:hypothetical protein DMC64_02965 [Amycolatopsis sp. WAC 04197]
MLLLTPALSCGGCCESHFRNVEGCESGFRNPPGRCPRPRTSRRPPSRHSTSQRLPSRHRNPAQRPTSSPHPSLGGDPDPSVPPQAPRQAARGELSTGGPGCGQLPVDPFSPRRRIPHRG